MAIHIDLRQGTAAAWASANPVLSLGELGATTDTYIFKIGDGVTAWNSLAVAPTGTATQTVPFQSLGDGSDGNVTISSGTTTMTRDMYYANLIISGTGQLITNGYKIFVSGVLDLTAAPAGAINFNGVTGSAASGSTGGGTNTGVANGSVGGTQTGGAGATGTTAAGTAGTAGTAGSPGNGGDSNASGAGGIGSSGAGGAARAGVTSGNPVPGLLRFETNLLRQASLILGGSGGGGGGSGAGDGINSGAGGGAGGTGGGVLAIYANVILRSSSTAQNTIEALGGMGGAGASATTGVTGGGGAGSGGGGGWVYIAYNYLAGPSVINFINASGGMGGQGGNGFGSAAGIVSGGGGGDGGYGGRITLFDIVTQTGQEVFGVRSAEENPQVTTGTLAVGSTGGIGGLGGPSVLTI